MPTVPSLSNDQIKSLQSIVGDEFVSAKNADLDQHSRDQSFHQAHLPAVVVWTRDTQQVSKVLKFANENLIPVTAWGAGTSIEGNPIPVCGGIVLDVSRMDKILKVYKEDFQVDVQPGIKYKDMNAVLSKQGLFYAPDPGANASIGGMVANNAAGTRTPGYGATRENVLRLEVVLASGEIIRTGTRSVKTSSGYDLVHLFIGSEGTLGVVTEATLKLVPLPEKFSAVVAAFKSVEGATQVVSTVMGSGLRPVALEYVDVNTVKELNTTGEFKLPEHPTLLLEFHSATEAGLEEELDLVEEICSTEGCVSFQKGMGRDERDRLWKMRHHTYEVLVRNNPGTSFVVCDVAAPASAYPKLIDACNKAMESRGIKSYIVGHAGDGNAHPLIPYLPNDPESYKRASEASGEMVEAALALGGTATGEHGVGIGKRKYMAREHGASLEVMRAIKKTLDPNGILNPEKMI